jgi:hypothetical protein
MERRLEMTLPVQTNLNTSIGSTRLVTSETQITKIEATLSDGHKFKRRGNEEQFKHNNNILSKIKEADNVLEATALTTSCLICC